MRRNHLRLCGLGMVLLGLVGCHSAQPNIKPEYVEEYNIPPMDDPRFSDPHYNYPNKVLNQYAVKPESSLVGPGKGGPAGMGGAGGMQMPGNMGPRPSGNGF